MVKDKTRKYQRRKSKNKRKGKAFRGFFCDGIMVKKNTEEKTPFSKTYHKKNVTKLPNFLILS